MDFSSIGGQLSVALAIFKATWWFVLPIVLVAIFLEVWKDYIREKSFQGLTWVLLEITPPPDVQKSPKIAENLFNALHALYGVPLNWKKRFLQGKSLDWYSFEIAGRAGEMKFYIRCLESTKNFVEAQVFAQYPDAEIKVVVDDYISVVPAKLPNDEYDVFGVELIFTKDSAFPIKTYPHFEEEHGKDEFVRSSPLAPLAEIISMLVPEEHIWIQILARPVGDSWVKEAQKAADKVMGKEEKKPDPDLLQKGFGMVDSALSNLSGAEAKKEEKKEKQEFSLQKLTPGQKFVLEQIEEKMMRLGYEAGIRFLYVAKKDVFNRSRISAITGMFKQFYFNNLNSFRPNMKVSTYAKGKLSWLFPSEKGFWAAKEDYTKKKNIYQAYRERRFVDKEIILNTEELATLFNMPGLNVRAPAFMRVEAKKGQPPAGLPTR
jgi:hypothetical protein